MPAPSPVMMSVLYRRFRIMKHANFLLDSLSSSWISRSRLLRAKKEGYQLFLLLVLFFFFLLTVTSRSNTDKQPRTNIYMHKYVHRHRQRSTTVFPGWLRGLKQRRGWIGNGLCNGWFVVESRKTDSRNDEAFSTWIKGKQYSSRRSYVQYEITVVRSVGYARWIFARA